jgi:hypothetical protein
MKKVYRVKLNETNYAEPTQIVDGYLATDGEIHLYSRGEAMKKAARFGGTIEPFGKAYTVTPLNLVQLSKSELSPELVGILSGLHQYTYLTGRDYIYGGDIFDGILCQRFIGIVINEALEKELQTLAAIMYSTDYFMLLG